MMIRPHTTLLRMAGRNLRVSPQATGSRGEDISMSMPLEIWVHDAGIGGVIPEAAGRRVIKVDKSWSAMQIANKVRATALAAGGASTLWVLFHASYVGESLAVSEGGWADALFGGLSELGSDGITSRNVAEFGHALSGIFAESIRLLACGAAARWNGMEICRRLAFHSQTLVIASQDTQQYTINKAKGQLLDIGVWEGRVFKFLPTGEAVAWFVGPTADGSEEPRQSVNPPILRR
ncbi:MAG TPA: hypothetical protein VEN28_07455 [Burkholderiaceae bacterium]|jgi:hypothetical protein|nr:hypothetical protein [Burkholderiaceae bacterium]